MLKKQLIGIILFFLLSGVYLFPERIKLVSILCVVLLVAYYSSIRYCKIINTRVVFLWGAFVVLGGLVSLINGLSLNTSLEFIITIFIGLMIGNIYMSASVRNSMLSGLSLFGMVVLLGCFLQLVFPEYLSEITVHTLGDSKYASFKDFVSYNALVGFSYQTGVTGFYLAVLDGLVLSYFLGKKDKTDKLSLLLITIYVVIYVLILLTGKRAQLLSVLLLSSLLITLYNKEHVNKIIIGSTVLIVGVTLLLYKTNAGQMIIARTQGLNATTGRSYLNGILLSNFKNSPIVGNGFGYTLKTIEQFSNGHNVYLQVLSENGVLGLLLYLSILVFYSKQAIDCLKYLVKNNYNSHVVAICLYIEGLFILNSFVGNSLYDVYPIILYLISSGIIASTLIDIRNDNLYGREIINKKDI